MITCMMQESIRLDAGDKRLRVFEVGMFRIALVFIDTA